MIIIARRNPKLEMGFYVRICGGPLQLELGGRLAQGSRHTYLIGHDVPRIVMTTMMIPMIR